MKKSSQWWCDWRSSASSFCGLSLQSQPGCGGPPSYPAIVSAGGSWCWFWRIPWPHDSSVVSGILMWQYLPSSKMHSILAALSPNILCVDRDHSDYVGGLTFLSLGLKGSVPGSFSVRQIRVKDNILSSVLLLSLPASLSLFYLSIVFDSLSISPTEI